MLQVLGHAQATPDAGILVVPVDLADPLLVVFFDSSWANAEGLKTHVGYLLLLADRSVLETPCRGTLLEHRSVRTPRVARSTLAGEAIAATTAVDAAYFQAALLFEVLRAVPSNRQDRTIPIVAVTDCKSLYDSVRAAKPTLNEKRTIIDSVAVNEVLAEDGLRWCPTWAQLADGMTKYTAELVQGLASFLLDPAFCLVDTQDFIEDNTGMAAHRGKDRQNEVEAD